MSCVTFVYNARTYHAFCGFLSYTSRYDSESPISWGIVSDT